MRVQTHSVHFHADGKLLDYTQAKLARLSRVNDRIQDADVFFKLENSGQVRDKVVEVRLHVPGGSLFEKKTSRTFEAALDTAVRGLRAQIVRLKEKLEEARHSNSSLE
jgi:putative sigma-54 modulation protein